MAPPSSYSSDEQTSYDVFISHCKRAEGTEDRALWIVDTFEEAGMKPFFDLQNLEEISREQIIKEVKSSKAMVTVIDPETFRSDWVILENQTAFDNGIPIIPFYDGDRWKWNDISFWVGEFPNFFKIPAIEYHKTYHKQSKQLLISKAKGEKRFGDKLVLPNEVVSKAAKELAAHMKEQLDRQALPPQCAKLCRASDNLSGETGSMDPDLAQQPNVDASLADVRNCVEESAELVHEVANVKGGGGGGGGCCGGKGATVAPAPVSTVDGLLSKDVELATLRSVMRKALSEARRTTKLKKMGSASSIADFWKGMGESGKSWDELMGVLSSELKSAGAADEELAAAAERAASLLPKLKTKLVGSDGQIKKGALHEAFGEDGGNVTSVLLGAAESAQQVEKVYSPEIKTLTDGGKAVDAKEFGDVGFVMVREKATLSELRVILAKALASTSFATAAKSGAYSFYLHDGQTKVAPAQEAEFEVFEHVPGLILVPGVAAAGAGVVSANELFAEAKFEAEVDAKGEYAASLTLQQVLMSADLKHRFQRLTYGDIGEENIQFLSEMTVLREEMSKLATPEMQFAFALPKMRFLNVTFIVAETTMKLSCAAATKATAASAFAGAVQAAKGGTRDANSLVACFSAVEAEVTAACEALLPKLKQAVTSIGPLKSVGKARRTVVVVGAGLAGSFTARWFDRYYHDKLDTILVDPKEYHEITFMTLRATVQNSREFQNKMRVPHSDYVVHGQVVVEQCQEVALDHIKVGSSGKDLHVIPFDYLFISTGCHYAENIKTNSPSLNYRIQQYEAARRQIAESKRVLIIGAGVVGNELCGEIIDAFPKKEVIMVGRSTILSRAGPEAHRLISEHWKSKGVKCIFNEEMLPLKPGDTHYTTAKGTKIPVDGTRAFWCLGRQQPNTHFLEKNFGRSALDPLGYIKIDSKCRVQGVPRGNIFASGDCVFAPAHPAGDRGYFGFNVHSFVARENIVALHEQLAAGTPHELCDPPQEMQFKIDPKCESGTGAVWVEPFKMLSLGHQTFYLQLTALPKGYKNCEISEDFAKRVQAGETKTHCWLMKKGGEARQKGELERCDHLRETKHTPMSKDPGMPHQGFKLLKPGKDQKGFNDFMGLFFSRPKLAKMILGVMLKGQLDCAVMTELQKQEADEAEKKLAEMGDDFEIIDASK